MNKQGFVLALIIIPTALMLAPSLFAGEVTTAATFSQVQCEYLSQDWKEIYLKTLDLGFDLIRLGAYWSRIEAEEGVYDFSELDWQMEQASKKGIKVLLTVGMKAPRWPEYFIPSWLEKRVKLRYGSDPTEQQLLTNKLFLFIEKVVLRYRQHPAIVAWQVENEPFTRSGPRDLWINKNFVEREKALIRRLDPRKRPLVINAMTYSNGFLRFLVRLAYRTNPVFDTIDSAEIPAINVYPVVGHTLFSKKVCFWSNLEGQMRYLKVFLERAKNTGKDLWVTELQAEPWEPGELVHLREEAAQTCQPESFVLTYRQLTDMGVTTIFFWGVEYWFYRAEKYGDTRWLEACPCREP
ncbi:MAG: beta-galactosidase [Candidatus Omnitrophota bacterium]